MSTFIYQPPLPRTAPASFVQTVRMTAEGKDIGGATWVIPAVDGGVMQLLTLEITATNRRHGYAKQLLSEVLGQGNALCKLRKKKLRKVWMLVQQKEQVIGRSFLTGQSFHHVATVSNLLKDEDGLVYVRAFD
jgi:hypothetical protein